MSTYPYLNDKKFLTQISTQREQEHYVRIIMLNWNDEKIEGGEIQGLVTGGNISVNGNSAVRRTGSLSCVVDGTKLKATVTDINNLIAINKRAQIEIGLKNNTNQYVDDDIIWFPQGVFILSGASVQHNAQGVTISANLKDKMCLLNGECGGMFSRAMVHTPIYVYNNDSATPIKQHVLFRALITSLVQEYSGLSADKIHIRIADTDPEDGYPMPQRKDYTTSEAFNDATEAWQQAAYNKIDQIVSWTGKQSLYYYNDGTFSTVSMAGKTPAAILQYGDAMGYQRVPFTYPIDKELTSNTGESVVSVLDKIKATLGNFEYFFDINGEFWFQPIANFQNKGLEEDNLANAIKKGLQNGFEYGKPTLEAKTTFNFSGLNWVTAVTNSPKYEAIKNDLSITGVRGDNKQMIQYHLVFEDKVNNNKLTIPEDAKFSAYTDDLGIVRLKYDAKGVAASKLDYRTQMYLGYLALEATNSLPSEAEWRLWGKELKEWWPHTMQFIVNQETGAWTGEEQFKVLSNPHSLHNMNYYFEMIDMSAYSLNVSQIGHRPKSINNDKVNVIFQTEPPHVFCVVASSATTAKDRKDALDVINGLNSKEPKPDPLYTFTQVPPSYGNSIAQGIAQNSAYDNMRSMVHSVIQYNESINITILPLYFLEPNTLVALRDPDAGILGTIKVDADGNREYDENNNLIYNPCYYELKSYSVPLTSNGTMSLSCVRATTLI